MKTAEEFRKEVYEKQGAAVAQRQKRHRRSALCVSLALFVTLCGVGVPRLLSQKNSDALRPRLLQVGSPKNPVDLSDDKAVDHLEEMKAKMREMAQNQEKIETLKDQIDQEAFERTESPDDIILDEKFARELKRFAAESAAQAQLDTAENACFSPISLFYNFSLLAAGAGSDTAESLHELLRADQESLSDQCRRYYAQHYQDKADSVFRLENSLWLDSAHTYSEKFIQKAEEYFYSYLFLVDFEDLTVANDMTKWVSDNTGGRVAPNFELSEGHKASILNSLDYRTAWGCDFDPALTTAGTFTKADGSMVTANYMHTTTGEIVYTFEGKDGATFTAALLPLTNYDTMVFVLPDEAHPESLGDLFTDESLFNAAFFYQFRNDFFHESTVAEISWSIPKFEIKSEHDFADMLPPIAKDEVLADFRNMGNVELLVYKVQQDIGFGIDETGIGGVSSVGEKFTSRVHPDSVPVEMNLNRPFGFAVISRSATFGGSAESVVYCGVCGDPSQN